MAKLTDDEMTQLAADISLARLQKDGVASLNFEKMQVFFFTAEKLEALLAAARTHDKGYVAVQVLRGPDIDDPGLRN